ncbi:MAG: CpsD/CapB family tyrosine-protein kinase [Planctomycetales bacterium]|nr:CpsD/CapB family tyrosine-protein kinase [Planctomycetales bacterium]
MITQSTLRSLPHAIQPLTLPSQTSEAQHYYLTLLRSLAIAGTAESPFTTLGVTSCYPGEGVSTVAVQLSLAAAATGMRVLLVDLNWKRPAIHETFGVQRGPGLSEALANAGRQDPPIQASSIPNLSLLTVGNFVGDFNLAISLERMAGLIRSLHDYDLIVFDMCESAEAGPSLSLSSLLEGVLLVIEAERVRWEVALRVKELLVRSGVNVLGAVLNKRRRRIPRWLYRTL